MIDFEDFLGPFHSKEGSYISPLTNKKIPLRVFATGEHVHQTQLLLDTTARILPVYEKVCFIFFIYFVRRNTHGKNPFSFVFGFC